jgi:predicted dehydrogenase
VQTEPGNESNGKRSPRFARSEPSDGVSNGNGNGNGHSANGHNGNGNGNGNGHGHSANVAHLARPVSVVVVGYGYWGPNLVRNVVERPDLHLAALCERDPARAAAFATRVPGVPVLADLDAALALPGVEAVIVATPPRTHHAICMQALRAGKHVLVEKPLATTTDDALDLVATAEDLGQVLMPGHTFVYSPSVNKIRDLIREDVLGDVYFVTSSRMNLGKYQQDGVVCDLAPHDLSILLYWLEKPVTQIATNARSVFQDDVPETAFLSLTFEGGTAANVQISWLAPRKVRQMVVVGSKRMVQYDDTASDESVRVYDRGMEFSTPESFGEYQLTYRSGDVLMPRIEPAEPLNLELEDFATAIRTGREPRSNAKLGLQIVQAIEAAEQSLRRGGEPVSLAPVGDLAAA